MHRIRDVIGSSTFTLSPPLHPNLWHHTLNFTLKGGMNNAPAQQQGVIEEEDEEVKQDEEEDEDEDEDEDKQEHEDNKNASEQEEKKQEENEEDAPGPDSGAARYILKKNLLQDMQVPIHDGIDVVTETAKIFDCIHDNHGNTIFLSIEPYNNPLYHQKNDRRTYYRAVFTGTANVILKDILMKIEVTNGNIDSFIGIPLDKWWKSHEKITFDFIMMNDTQIKEEETMPNAEFL